MPVDTNTWRNIIVDGTTFRGTGIDTGALEFSNDFKINSSGGSMVSIGVDWSVAPGVLDVQTKTSSGGSYTSVVDANDIAKIDLSPYLGVNETAFRAARIPYGECDRTSTSTKFTATVPGITELKDGVTMLLYNGVITSASGFTININGLGEKPCYSNMAQGNNADPQSPVSPTRDTTIFNINYAFLFVYREDLGSDGGWIGYRGYDANTNTIGYQVRTNNTSMVASDKFYRYRLLFTSADGTKWVPANTSTLTNTTGARTPNTRPIDPFGEIVWYGTTTAIESGAVVTAAQLWQQYYGTYTNIGYSFNNTGIAPAMTANLPIYIKCTPRSDGSATIDIDQPYTQTLPTTEDGKIYIYLGRAYNTTNFEITIKHPVYYYKGGALREWTNDDTWRNITVDGTTFRGTGTGTGALEFSNDFKINYSDGDPVSIGVDWGVAPGVLDV